MTALGLYYFIQFQLIGLGGGFNERGRVEYKKRPDSDDDEFDEFGRRKKNRKSGGLPQQLLLQPPSPQIEEDEVQG